MPRIQLLVVQPTPFCNIDCRYCYLPDRTNKAVVAEATLANLFSQVFASAWVRDGVPIVWHAGEPGGTARDVRVLRRGRHRPGLLQCRGERGGSRLALLRGSGDRGCLLSFSARILAIGGGVARQIRPYSRDR